MFPPKDKEMRVLTFFAEGELWNDFLIENLMALLKLELMHNENKIYD